MCYIKKQAGGYSQCRVRVAEMEGQDVLDTVWLIYKCFTQGDCSPQESITGEFSNVIKHAVTIAQKRCHRELNCLWCQEKKLHRSSRFINIHIVQPRSSVVTSDSSSPPRPPLLGLVCFVCGEEGHAVGPEVGVEVRGLVETPAAHLAVEIPVSVLALPLRGAGGGAVRRAVSAGGAAVRVALGVPHSVSDEAVPAEGAGRREADAALQALEGGGVAPMLGDVALKLRPVLCGEAAGDASENVVLLL